jgi:hypothetical protein
MGNNWKIVFATVVIFATGVITGGLLVNHPNRAKQQRASRLPANRTNWQPDPREVVQRDQRELRPMLDQQRMDFILRVHEELRLTPEQRERIEKIVREGQERSKTFWEKAAPEMRKNMQEVREQILVELKPDQRKKFEQIQKQRQTRPPEPAPGMGVGTGPGRGNVDPRRPVQSRDGLRPDRGFTPPGGQPSPLRDGSGTNRTFTPPAGEQPVPPLPPVPDKR